MPVAPTPGGSLPPVGDLDGPGPGPTTSDAGQPSASGWWTAGRVIPAAVVLLAVPLVVALVALRRPQWFPVLDLAMTELRLRDVGTADTPLVGLPGRIGGLGPDRGSHPGPLSFYLLAAPYRLLGSSAWAMQVGAALVHTAAVAVTLWLARRRGGLPLVLATTAVLALLMRFFGPSFLTEPWNPYLPLLWWVAMLVAVWSVLDHDLVALPVAVFAGSLAAQTHVPYAPVVVGIGALGLVGAVVAVVRAPDPARRRRLLGWIAASAVLGGLLWTPPVVEQLTAERGNATKLLDHFSEPEGPVAGLATGVERTLVHLDPWRLLSEQRGSSASVVEAARSTGGSVVPGLVVLAVWVASAVLARRLGHVQLVRLHLVVGCGLVLAVVAVSRIFGQMWYYLTLWVWGVTAMLLLAVGWTAVAYVAHRWRPTTRHARHARHARRGSIALVAVAVVSTAVFAVRATEVVVPAEPEHAGMAALVPDVVDALEGGGAPATGRAGRYLVTWSDALYIGSQGMSLLNELEREGFDVGALRGWTVEMGAHRVLDPVDATAEVHLANGVHVDAWRQRPGVREIASVDPRTPAEAREHAAVRARVLDALRRDGLDHLVPLVDENLFRLAIEPDLPADVEDDVTRLLALGLPTAVFLAPPGTGG